MSKKIEKENQSHLKESNHLKENVQRNLFGELIVSEKNNVYINKNKKQKDLSDSIETKYIVEIVCIDANEQELMYNELIKKGFTCQVLTL